MATGQIPPINPALMPPNPLMPPPTTPPVFGFQVWAQDPANAHKVQAAMTGPGQPLQPNHPDNMSAAAQPPAQPPMASIAPPAQANTMAPPMGTVLPGPAWNGMVEPGNLNIWNRPSIQNADGTHSSEYSTSFGDENGREILVPTIADGKFLTPDGTKPAEGSPQEAAMFQAAQSRYRNNGENLGVFSSPDAADSYANALHNRAATPIQEVGKMAQPLPPGGSVSLPPSTNPMMPPAQRPTVVSGQQSKLTQAPPMQPMQDKMAADQARLTQLQQSGAGASHVKNPFLHALAKVGDIAAPFILGGGAAAIPGTTVHNRMLQRDAAGNIERDQTAIDSSLKAQEMGASTAHLRMETAQGPQRLALDQMKANSNLAQHGLKTDENGQIVADETSPAYQKQKAMSDYLSSRQELAEAQKQLTDAKTKNQPVLMRQAQQRLNTAALNAQTAIGRLGLSEKEYSMHAYGTDGQGNALPGALLDDDGTPIGTANAPNVRPTAKQRDKIDLAGNAQENINSIKSVIARRPDLFGPAAGRKTDIDVWLGSQDPDAQTVRAAMEGGGLALAGIHGTRGEYAVKGIHDVLGNFKTNPQALNAGLDQLLKSSESFSKPHSLRTAPGRNNMQPPTQGGKTGDPLGIR